MKKFITLILTFTLVLTCASALVSCTDGENTDHNIIIGDENSDDEVVKPDETTTENWELGGVPLG